MGLIAIAGGDRDGRGHRGDGGRGGQFHPGNRGDGHRDGRGRFDHPGYGPRGGVRFGGNVIIGGYYGGGYYGGGYYPTPVIRYQTCVAAGPFQYQACANAVFANGYGAPQLFNDCSRCPPDYYGNPYFFCVGY